MIRYKYFLLLVVIAMGCKTNKEQVESGGRLEDTSTTAEQVLQRGSLADSSAANQQVPVDMIENRTVNPDDCRLSVKVLAVSPGVLEGGIVEIVEKGFGFSDYINSGDTREFLYDNQKVALKKGMLVNGVITSIGNSTDKAYTLKEIKIIRE